MPREELQALLDKALLDTDARCAYVENTLRQKLAAVFEAARNERGLSVRDLAELMQTSPSQVQRLLHHERGGSLTLMTVARAADALGMMVSVHLRPVDKQVGNVIPFGNAAWLASPAQAATTTVKAELNRKLLVKVAPKHWVAATGTHEAALRGSVPRLATETSS